MVQTMQTHWWPIMQPIAVAVVAVEDSSEGMKQQKRKCSSTVTEATMFSIGMMHTTRTTTMVAHNEEGKKEMVWIVHRHVVVVDDDDDDDDDQSNEMVIADG